MTRLFCLAVAIAIAAPSIAQAQQPKIRRDTENVSPRQPGQHVDPRGGDGLVAPMPMMAVFNNLVMYDQQKAQNSLDTIVPDLAESWAWSGTARRKLTFKLRQGVKWHDGKPFTAKDVKCTWDLLLGKAQDKLRLNPRKAWYHNLEEVTRNGDHEVTFKLKRPQPAFLALLASGCSPVYPCHVPPREMRSKPIGTGPFKFVEFKPNEVDQGRAQPGLLEEGPALSRRHRVHDHRRTARPRILAFVVRRVRHDLRTRRHDPAAEGRAGAGAEGGLPARPDRTSAPTCSSTATAPPFDNPEMRRAMALAIDRKAFIDILSEGKVDIGGAMLPPPEGVWGMPADMLRDVAGLRPGRRQEPRRGAQDHGRARLRPGQAAEGQGLDPQHPALSRPGGDPDRPAEEDLHRRRAGGRSTPPSGIAKVTRKDYTIGLNLTGIAVDDPDAISIENYTCKAERNYTGYCNPEIDKLIDQQSKRSRCREAQGASSGRSSASWPRTSRGR